MKKAVKPIRFSYKNCTSVLTYKARYCGVCTDGRCCTPHSTDTVQVEFQCAQGKAVKKPVMFINTCACHYHCPRDNAVYRPSDLVYSGYTL
nr:protein NOV-like [Salvelinus alpinus]